MALVAMKKAVVIIVVTLLITGILAVITILSCNNNGSETSVNGTDTETPVTNDKETIVTDEDGFRIVPPGTYGTHADGEPIYWGNPLDFPVDEDGYWFGILYREVDLSQADAGMRPWYESGVPIESWDDCLAPIFGQPITTRVEAVYIANKIAEIAGGDEGFRVSGVPVQLVAIERDPNKDIWIFVYGMGNVNIVSGPGLSIAISGDGEPLREWFW